MSEVTSIFGICVYGSLGTSGLGSIILPDDPVSPRIQTSGIDWALMGVWKVRLKFVSAAVIPRHRTIHSP